MESLVMLCTGSSFVLFSPWGELPTGWSVGGCCQDPTCREGTGTEEAERRACPLLGQGKPDLASG